MLNNIRRKLNNFSKDNKGGISIATIGMCIFLMVVALIIVEGIRFYQSYEVLETATQRSLTAAVEQNMSYAHRADGKLCLYIDTAPPIAFGNNEVNANLNAGRGAYKDFKTLMSEALGVPTTGDSFIKHKKDGSILYNITITSHSGTDSVVTSSPYMQVNGTVTFYPIFSNMFGIDPMVTNFSYVSKNFHIIKDVQTPEETDYFDDIEWDEN